MKKLHPMAINNLIYIYIWMLKFDWIYNYVKHDEEDFENTKLIQTYNEHFRNLRRIADNSGQYEN